jgi:hypothetical protein
MEEQRRYPDLTHARRLANVRPGSKEYGELVEQLLQPYLRKKRLREAVIGRTVENYLSQNRRTVFAKSVYRILDHDLTGESDRDLVRRERTAETRERRAQVIGRVINERIILDPNSAFSNSIYELLDEQLYDKEARRLFVPRISETNLRTAIAILADIWNSGGTAS